MSSRENTFLWIIFFAPLGMGLGFIIAPPDPISQIIYTLVGTIIFTAATCAAIWAIKRFNSGSSE